jgi:serine/threonine protein kinase
MTRNWNDLEGVSLGRHWLKVCLQSSADDAWYLIRYDTTRDAAIRVRDAAAPDAESQLDLWRRATAIEHPHLVRMLDAGRADAEGDAVIYCVCEYPDEFLAGILAERPLLPSEAREVLDASLSALDFLHDHGLVHGALEARHIQAFGDTIKLPSDTLRVAGPDAPPESDLRALGVMLHEVLTREPPRADARTDFSYLPEPFRSIIRHTAKSDGAQCWSMADIRTHLNPPPPKPAPEPEPEPAAPAAVETAPVTLPPAVERPTLPPPRPRAEVPVDRGFPLKWIPVAGLAAAAVLGAFVLRSPERPAAAPAPEVSAPAPVVRTAPPTSAPKAAPVSTPAITPQPAKPSAFPESRADRTGSPDARPSTGARIWRVIAYTYNGRTNAEKKARSLNAKHPAWRAEVFTPKGDRPPYLISLGGRTTLAEAERIQRDARSKGLPRDTFVRNYSN